VLVEYVKPLRFLSWSRDDEVALPPGLSLLTGSNGSGKSALALEAVAWAVWKKTVRGTKPEGEVYVTASSADGRRWRIERTDSSVILSEDTGDGWAHRSGQTLTETQERIERVFGTWRRFTNTRVFSRRLLSRLGTATDKERKAILEEAFGLTRFEDAYQVALKERKRRDGLQLAAHAECQRAQAELDQARRSLQALADRPGDLVEDVQRKVAEVADRMEARAPEVQKLAQKAQVLADGVQKVQDELSKVRAEGQVRERRIAALERAGAPKVCPTCRRPLDAESGAAATAHVAAERADLAQQRDALATRARGIDRGLEDLRARRDAASRAHAEAHAQVAAMDRELAGLSERHRAALARRDALDDLERQAGEASDALDAAKDILDEADRALAVADHACRILGPKGVRVRLLSASLALLEVEANVVLARLGGQARALRVSGSRTKADGDEVAEVSIRVEGAGGGEYRGASDGEVGRLDSALLLGLARLSGDRGYVCFDEPFDGLDREGLAGVCEVLREMAQERQVVVVTHSDDLVSTFPAAHHLLCRRDGDGPSELVVA